jgi:hypothetical protein
MIVPRRRRTTKRTGTTIAATGTEEDEAAPTLCGLTPLAVEAFELAEAPAAEALEFAAALAKPEGDRNTVVEGAGGVLTGGMSPRVIAGVVGAASLVSVDVGDGADVTEVEDVGVKAKVKIASMEDKDSEDGVATTVFDVVLTGLALLDVCVATVCVTVTVGSALWLLPLVEAATGRVTGAATVLAGTGFERIVDVSVSGPVIESELARVLTIVSSFASARAGCAGWTQGMRMMGMSLGRSVGGWARSSTKRK